MERHFFLTFYRFEFEARNKKKEAKELAVIKVIEGMKKQEEQMKTQ